MGEEVAKGLDGDGGGGGVFSGDGWVAGGGGCSRVFGGISIECVVSWENDFLLGIDC